MEINRHAEAIPEWLAALSLKPDNASCLANLALCQSELMDKKSAYANVQKAIASAPEAYFPKYVYGRFLIEDDQDKKAEEVARDGLQSNPENIHLLSVLAGSLIGQRRWKEAMELAGKALAIDPEYAYALNIRTHCLSILGDKAAISASLEALSIHTEEPNVHTTHGFALLRSGESRKAAEAFREALRLDPSYENARTGLKEALRSLFPPYRWLKSYQYFCQRHAKLTWLIFIVVIVVKGGSQEVIKNGPPWAKVAAIATFGIAFFLLYGWVIIPPLSNVIFRFHPIAKYMLTKAESVQAVYFGSFFVMTVVSGIASAFSHAWIGLLAVSAIGFCLIGFCGSFTGSQKTQIALTHALGILFGLGAIVATVMTLLR